MYKIQTNFIVLRAANVVFQKSQEKICEVPNVRVTAGHRPAQAQEEPAEWGRFPSFLSGVTKMFFNIELKFLNSRVLVVL